MAELKEKRVIATNKKAYYEYFVIDKFKAGVILHGTEVKSVRASKVSMSDAFCYFRNEELWLKNLHIAEYKFGGFTNHEPKAVRKLLLKKRELKKLLSKTKEKGLTIVPLEVYLSERDYVKVEIALVKGKKSFDKRKTIKDKDMRRETDRRVRF